MMNTGVLLMVSTKWVLSALRVINRPVPVPVRLIVCGLPGALSVMEMAPLRVPSMVGVKVTLIAQLLPATSELPQLFVCAKPPALVPVIAMLVRLRLAPPVLLTVTV